MGLRSLDVRLRAAILDVSKLDRKVLVSNEESVREVRRLLDEEGIFAGVSAGAVGHVARKLAAELDGGVVVAVFADGGWKYLSADFWEAEDVESLDGANDLVVISDDVREAIVAHSEREGAERSVRPRPVPRRARRALRAGAQQRSFAVPVRAGVRRSGDLVRGGRRVRARRLSLARVVACASLTRTDVENIGLWEGKPYVIYSLRLDELAAFRIEDGQIVEVPLEALTT